jgi:hypothetical protein
MTFAWKLVSTVCCQWIAFIVTYISQSDAGGEMKSGGKQKQVRQPILGLLANGYFYTSQCTNCRGANCTNMDRSSGKQFADNLNAFKLDHCLRLTINQCETL